MSPIRLQRPAPGAHSHIPYMRKSIARLLLRTVVAALTLGACGAAFAFDQWITLPNGQRSVIDWSAGQLRTTGQAVPPTNASSAGQKQLLARRGAILDGQRNLLESLAGVYVTSDTTMLNLMANDVVRSSVEGIVAGAVVTSEEWDPATEIYTVEMEIPLGPVRDAVMGDKILTIPPNPKPETPTGLILDVGGLGAVPSLTFTITTLDGFIVTSVAQAFYFVSTPAGYAATLEDAKRDSRVASAPLVIRALALGANGIDILVSESDGALLAMYLNDLDFFGGGRTLVVMY